MIKERALAQSVRLICSAGALGASLLALPASAQVSAQSGAQPGGQAGAQDNGQTMQRVVVTGSAIKRIDAETAVPVTVVRMEDLRKQGINTVEQVMSNLAPVQASQGTSQVVGLSTGGASFADMRGIGANKTLVLLNGRRLANNSFNGAAPDLNMIPFAALERVEVLRDGASSLYGSDAVGGVINFITRRDFTGGTVTLGYDKPEDDGGIAKNANLGFGVGSLDTDGFNFFAIGDFQKQAAVTGLQRDFNTRYPGGLSPTTSPANYFQGGDSGNPAAPGCTSAPNLIPAGDGLSRYMTTSSFVDYVPTSERASGLFKGTLKLPSNHELGLEYLISRSRVGSQIAPVPYGGLIMNRLRPNGTLNPYFPGNPGAIAPSIPISPTYVDATGLPPGAQPGYLNVKWRDLPNGPRVDDNTNRQQRFVASISGAAAGWDYSAALSYNENKVNEDLRGYSDGCIISAGVLNGIINPFGDQSAESMTLIESAALDGTIQTAKGTTKTFDFSASHEFGDWANAGKNAALAVGGQASRENFVNRANSEYAEKVVASTGIDPNLLNQGARTVYAAFAELNVPLMAGLDVTAALRYDKYSDFGSTTNPKFGFRYQPSNALLVRGSYSTGFRAPSLYEINAAQTYTNTPQQDDPVNCPGGTPLPGKSRSTNCAQQFQALGGGNLNLDPEESKNITLGVVFEPVNNLTLGLDLYQIELKKQIGTLNQDEVFADPVKYAALYHRNGAGNLSTDGSQCPNPATCGFVDLRTQNLGGLETNGIDVTAAYRMRTGDWGNFNFGLNSTWVHKYEYQNSEGGEWNQNVGIYSGVGPVFRWQHSASLGWAMGQFGAGLSARHKTGYVDADPEFNVASYTTIDGFLSWTQPKGFGVTLGVRNLADRAPPLSYQTQTFQAGYDPRYTDAVGRTFYVRGTYNF